LGDSVKIALNQMRLWLVILIQANPLDQDLARWQAQTTALMGLIAIQQSSWYPRA
jgi:hypothetical protein